jgi:hypothetical protein
MNWTSGLNITTGIIFILYMVTVHRFERKRIITKKRKYSTKFRLIVRLQYKYLKNTLVCYAKLDYQN